MAAAQPSVFSGQDFSLLRDKNRFVLPPQFRSTLKELNAGETTMLLVKHDRWDCVMGFARPNLAQLTAEIQAQREDAKALRQTFDAQKAALDVYTYETVPFDGSGRFVMPDILCAIANIEDQLYFMGGGTFFLAWAPEEIYRLPAEEWRAYQISCRRLAERELAKAARK